MKRISSFCIAILLSLAAHSYSATPDNQSGHQNPQAETISIASMDDFLEDVELDLFFDVPQTTTYIDVAQELIMPFVIVGLEYLDRIKETIASWCRTAELHDQQDEARE